MKKINTIIIVGLLAVVVLVTGCKREYGTVTLGANIDNGRDAKVYIDDLTPCWHNNDLIRVNNQTCTTSAALGSSAQITDVVESSHYRAIYPADIVGDVDISNSNTIAVTLPRVQQYETDSHGDQKVKVPMGAYSNNESLTFHNLCSLIKVVVSNRTAYDFLLDSIVVTTGNAYLSGLGSATVVGNASDAVGMMVSSSARHSVSLAFAVANRPIIGRGDRDTYVYYIISPEFAEDDVTITLYSPSGPATFEKQASLQHNRMAQVSLTVEEWDEQDPTDPPSEDGALPGLFSVSATQQVHFSQGNLQYQASTNTWRFAEHQYDYVGTQTADGFGNYGGNVSGSDNSYISSTYSGWIDLFGWGTSGWNSGANCYQPWSTSWFEEDYYPGGSYINYLTGAYAEADWAWHNPISNGGNTAHQWRTLTSDECDYLFNTRTDASAKWGAGNINGIGGLIILPDNWTLPSGCLFASGLTSDDINWTLNSYTLSQWTLMEAAGAVFLPAAGIRVGSGVECVGLHGLYWLSTPINELDVSSVGFANGSYLAAPSGDYRWYGFSVRPVQDEE